MLILPLLGGYAFIHLLHYLRFRAVQLDGYRLLIESGLAGAVLTLLARLVTVLLHDIPLRWFRAFDSAWDVFAPLPFSGAAVGALLLGIAIPLTVNLFVDKEAAKSLALIRYGTGMTRLFYRAAMEERLVMVTLDNRKVYIGFVAEAAGLAANATVAILPIISGHREAATMKLHFDVQYAAVYEPGVDTRDFWITLPVSSVKMASYFDPSALEMRFAGKAAGAGML